MSDFPFFPSSLIVLKSADGIASSSSVCRRTNASPKPEQIKLEFICVTQWFCLGRSNNVQQFSKLPGGGGSFLRQQGQVKPGKSSPARGRGRRRFLSAPARRFSTGSFYSGFTSAAARYAVHRRGSRRHDKAPENPVRATFDTKVSD